MLHLTPVESEKRGTTPLLRKHLLSMNCTPMGATPGSLDIRAGLDEVPPPTTYETI